VWYEAALVGMGIFVPKHITRHLFVHSSALFLNEFPFNGKNMVIEYNGLLADPSHQNQVYEKTIDHLFRSDVHSDEIYFSGVGEGLARNSLFSVEQDAHPGYMVKLREESMAWSVDLTKFEQGIDAYLATLSKNRRAQIRRAIGIYEQRMPLRLENARNTEEALAFFDGLKVLHTARWRDKGSQGSFSNSKWEAFHRSLIQSRFESGEIQLLRVVDSIGPIGYLYNFTWRNHVYVLQTGLKITEDKRLMPGYVVHVLAIAYNKQKEMETYDLMHGDSLYKRILCNHHESLQWIVVQRTRLKFAVEECARNLVRKFRGHEV
jgi:hypothetical protein